MKVLCISKHILCSVLSRLSKLVCLQRTEEVCLSKYSTICGTYSYDHYGFRHEIRCYIDDMIHRAIDTLDLMIVYLDIIRRLADYSVLRISAEYYGAVSLRTIQNGVQTYTK